jgi:hypothetical protein
MSEIFVREQRKFRRFELKLPVEVIRTGALRLSGPGETRNLSSGGVLFTVQSQMELGQQIEYCITLPTGSGSDDDVRLRCKGKVVRLERPNGDLATTSVAATLERYEFIRQSFRNPAPSSV